jgi:hypothetical protein
VPTVSVSVADLHTSDLAVLRDIHTTGGLTADEIETRYFAGFEQHRAEFADGTAREWRLGLLLKGKFVEASADRVRYVATERGAHALANA